MRQRLMATAAVLAVALLTAAQADAGKVEVKGPHICCKQCINVVAKLLDKVQGVSEVSSDVKKRTVTFTAANDAAAKAGVQALIDGGFYGQATADGKALKVDAPTPAKGKAVDSITVKDVHVCCGQCQKAVNGIFKDAKVSYQGTGAQRTVIINGANLEASAVLDALRKGGFNGKIE